MSAPKSNSKNTPQISRIRFDGVSVEMTNGHRVFTDLSFDFPMARVVELRGALGAGCSTLLRVLAGLQEAKSGRILINDVDVCPMSFEDFNPYRRAMGYGFEYGGLFNNRTLRQNLMLPFFYHQTISADEADAKVGRYLSLFGLEAVKDLRPAEASGGQRKACCVARALIVEPEMLILDNPVMGLDTRAREVLVQLIREQQSTGRLRHVFLAGNHEKVFEPFSPVELWLEGGQITQKNVRSSASGISKEEAA